MINDSTPGRDGRPVAVVPRALVTPEKNLAVLSRREVDALCRHLTPGLDDLFRRCALAVLSTGTDIDDARSLLARHRDFRVRLLSADGGLRLELENAPAAAFVGDSMIRGVREHLFAVLRDLVYITRLPGTDNGGAAGGPVDVTERVFNILRNAGVVSARAERPLAVCWGGHAISREEYDYTKEVGYAMGLRALDVCTGCGPGAMKGPMKGATIAHAKQRLRDGRYIGITEPEIIAAEAPNPIVNQLVIMPDIEKRLEAFVRLGHGIVVFPGGVGTAEELLFVLGILTHPENAAQRLPVILTGPRSAEAYFETLDRFVRAILGDAVAARYRIVIEDPERVATELHADIATVLARRDELDDAPHFNWGMHIDPAFQLPFVATHEAMNDLVLSRDLPLHDLALNLRRAFSGIVAGNVKEAGIAAVERHGPFRVRGDAVVAQAMDELLRGFVRQQRMRLPGQAYEPCYEIVS